MNHLHPRPGSSSPNSRLPPPPVPQHQYQAQYSSASSPWHPSGQVSQYQTQSQFQSFPPSHWNHGRSSSQNYPPPPGPPPGKAPLRDTVKAPLTTEQDIQRLFKVCQAGKGNASLLHEALVYANPADLKDTDSIIQVRPPQSLYYSIHP